MAPVSERRYTAVPSGHGAFMLRGENDRAGARGPDPRGAGHRIARMVPDDQHISPRRHCRPLPGRKTRHSLSSGRTARGISTTAPGSGPDGFPWTTVRENLPEQVHFQGETAISERNIPHPLRPSSGFRDIPSPALPLRRAPPCRSWKPAPRKAGYHAPSIREEGCTGPHFPFLRPRPARDWR